jgi:hypothetical protein
VVVDRHVQELPAEATCALSPVAVDAVALAHDDAQLLGVDVQQFAWGGVLVTLRGLDRLQGRELRQACAAQHAAHGGFRHPQAGGDARLGQPAPPELDDGQRLRFADAPRAVRRARACIGEGRLATGQIPLQPLARGPLAYQADHLESTGKGQSGILVMAHSVLGP